MIKADYINRALLYDVRHFLNVNQVKYMNKKRDDLLKTLNISSFESRILAEEMFMCGYLASFIEPMNEDNCDDQV